MMGKVPREIYTLFNANVNSVDSIDFDVGKWTKFNVTNVGLPWALKAGENASGGACDRKLDLKEWKLERERLGIVETSNSVKLMGV